MPGKIVVGVGSRGMALRKEQFKLRLGFVSCDSKIVLVSGPRTDMPQMRLPCAPWGKEPRRIRMKRIGVGR